MKLILSLAALLFAAPFVQAQVVVTNPISDILSQTMHVEDIAKTVEMINNQVKQITTLTQQLQQIQAYVKESNDSSPESGSLFSHGCTPKKRPAPTLHP